MVTALTRRHVSNRLRISSEAQRLIRRAWIVANGDEAAFAAEAAAVAASARSAVVAEVDAYLATAVTAQGLSTSPRGLDPDAYRRPVDPDVQWRRPYTHMRVKLSEGMEFAQAANFGRVAATRMVATDLQIANVRASRDWMSSEPRVTGYRRVLGGGNNCPLCIAASDQRYHSEVLAPIHDNCSCTVEPITDGRTSGLSEGRYQQMLEEQGVSVAEHGEVGPYLFPAGNSPPLLDAAA